MRIDGRSRSIRGHGACCTRPRVSIARPEAHSTAQSRPSLFRRGYLPCSAGADLRDARGGTFGHVLLETHYRVRFKRPLLLDLGGIAKGFAVDQAVRVLKRAGIASAVVNAGGDLRAFGPMPRRVHIRHPENPGAPALVGELHNAALATSGSYYLPLMSIRPASAIIDPHRRQSAPLRGSVSIVAPTCMIADALTKIVAIAGTAKGGGLSRWRAQAILL